MTFTIKVKGFTEKGAEHEERYLMLLENNVFDAMKKAIGYANEEYSCEYDENREPIANSEYKVFETITSVEVEE